MKQFSLEEYRSNPNRKIVTRDGRNARIICTDRNNKYPIVVLVNNGGEDIYAYDERGVYAGDNEELTLFFAPEKHDGWVNIYKTKDEYYTGNVIYNSQKKAKQNATSNVFTTAKVEWEE